MNTGNRRSRHEWTPVVGMKIKYRNGVNLDSKSRPDATAIVKSIDEHGTIAIEKDCGVKKNVSLKRKTWLTDWEPVSTQTEAAGPSPVNIVALTEDDVRRIVRDEFARIVNNISELATLAIEGNK